MADESGKGICSPVSKKGKAPANGICSSVSKKRKAPGKGTSSSVSEERKAPCPARIPTSRPIHVRLPVDPEERERLRDNLDRMQLSGLADLPWGVDAPSLYSDLLFNKPEVLSPVRANISGWTEEVISDTYGIPRNGNGSGMCDATDALRGFAEEFFQKGTWESKNGWTLDQCLDARNLRPIFAFLTPILKPRAQTRITLGLAITVTASFHKRKLINWAAILKDVVLAEARKLRPPKYTHIAPYISHIYHTHGCLTETEQLELCHSFPQPYAFTAQHQQESYPTPEFPLPPSDPSSIDNVPNSKLLEQLLDFLVCSPGELVNEVKRLKATDSRVPTVSSCSFGPTSPPSDPRGDHKNQIDHTFQENNALKDQNGGSKEIDLRYEGVLKAALDVQVREREICLALHSRETQTRNLGILNLHQGIHLTGLNCELEKLQERNKNGRALTERQTGEISSLTRAKEQLERRFESVQKNYSASTAEVQRLRDLTKLSEDSRKENDSHHRRLLRWTRDEIEDQTRQIDALKARLDTYTQEIKTTMETCRRMRDETERLRQRLSELTRANELLKEDSEQRGKLIENLRAENVTSDRDLESLRKSCEEASAKEDELVGGKWVVPDHCYSKPTRIQREPRTRIDDSELKGTTSIPKSMTSGVDFFEHQAKGLHWMLSMETDGANPMGGILADDQGMGKTVQLIGLILLHRFKESPTLIVCPSGVVLQWEQEIREKVSRPHRLNVLVYHGKGRHKREDDLRTWDVVITTYTLARQERPLHECRWHRIILDECQNIKNETGLTARGICDLHAKFRWCVSGTVLSNSHTELYSYFTFLRYTPLAGNSERSKEHRKAMRSLADKNEYRKIYRDMHTHLIQMTLRREKSILLLLGLPEKTYETIEVPFEREEDMIMYKRFEKLLARVMKKGKAKAAQGLAYMTILQQICLHRKLVGPSQLREEIETKVPLNKSQIQTYVATLYDCQEAGGECTHCQEPWGTALPSHLSACEHAFCEECSLEVRDGTVGRCYPQGEGLTCGEKLAWETMYSLADLLPVDDNLDIGQLGFDLPSNVGGPKFDAVMKYLHRLPVVDKDDSGKKITEKALIFSHWPSVFPYLKGALDTCGYQYRMVDGQMTLDARKEALLQFQTIPQVKVMLLSLHAANSGLNIVAANHVLLISHWWNPASEDQAVDRCHRLGQTKDVRVVRFVVEHTVESTVLNRQQFKRRMARGCLYGSTDLPDDGVDDGYDAYNIGEHGELFRVWQQYTKGHSDMGLLFFRVEKVKLFSMNKRRNRGHLSLQRCPTLDPNFVDLY